MNGFDAKSVREDTHRKKKIFFYDLKIINRISCNTREMNKKVMSSAGQYRSTEEDN